MSLAEKIRVGMSRQEVISVVGPPDDVGGTSRKYRQPSIFKYGRIELHFEPWKNGRLFLVYSEDDDLNGVMLMK
jgi:hypothetical protein